MPHAGAGPSAGAMGREVLDAEREGLAALAAAPREAGREREAGEGRGEVGEGLGRLEDVEGMDRHHPDAIRREFGAADESTSRDRPIVFIARQAEPTFPPSSAPHSSTANPENRYAVVHSPLTSSPCARARNGSNNTWQA